MNGIARGSAGETILAVSSGSGRAGVAVLRLSGPHVRFALETLARSLPEPRRAVLRRLRDLDGGTIDTALVLFFPAPASFTGEDVAEFHVHGSKAVLARMLAALTSLPGLRIADPGEFTRRAFEAGKLDLAAVEGLADLIDSETEWQRKQALRQMDGVLGRRVEAWRLQLIQAMALLEAEIDFSDESDIGGAVVEEALSIIASILQDLRAALGTFAMGERVRDGFVVVLAGPPNAGKSSLLNALAKRDVAIVSAIPGTTRDAIEVRLDLNGLPVTLIDTAGLRESNDPVESEGVRRSLALIGRADLVLRLRAVDSEPFFLVKDDRVLAIAAKADLTGTALPDELPVSAQTGLGVDRLLDAISGRISGRVSSEPALLTRERHRHAVRAAISALERVIAGDAAQVELLADDVRAAVRALQRLVGRIDVEDVLDQLFSGFCIGK